MCAAIVEEVSAVDATAGGGFYTNHLDLQAILEQLRHLSLTGTVVVTGSVSLDGPVDQGLGGNDLAHTWAVRFLEPQVVRQGDGSGDTSHPWEVSERYARGWNVLTPDGYAARVLFAGGLGVTNTLDDTELPGGVGGMDWFETNWAYTESFALTNDGAVHTAELWVSASTGLFSLILSNRGDVADVVTDLRESLDDSRGTWDSSTYVSWLSSHTGGVSAVRSWLWFGPVWTSGVSWASDGTVVFPFAEAMVGLRSWVYERMLAAECSNSDEVFEDWTNLNVRVTLTDSSLTDDYSRFRNFLLVLEGFITIWIIVKVIGTHAA